MESSRKFSGNTVGNNATVNQGDVTHITVNADISNPDKSFLQAISKTDPVHDKKRILLFKGPLLWDSFNWILGHRDVNKWRHTEESGVFWIKGDPGKGKTMLLCGIIEDLERNSQNANLSYFFCQATDYRINTAAAVVGGLIKSLLRRHPTLLSRIRENYEDGTKGQLDGANAFVILCDVFETIAKDPDLTNFICVVDALDECIKDCGHLLNLIIKTSGRVKWLLSSRNEKDIEKGLEQVPQRLVLELKENAEQISTSIDAYIRHHIQEIEALKDDEKLEVKTFDVLKRKAQGTFLWVSLVVDQLRKTDRWEVENVLEEMPKDLESLYGLILNRTEKLGERGQEVCQVILSIVTTAKRPLHLGELLVFINSHWKDNKHFKTTYELRDIRDMAKTCGSILSIREDTVYFIHQSAKDYVVENAARRIFPIQHQHYKMFQASLDAMSSILDYDIYGLEDPGIHINDVPQKEFGSDPLASIIYCCVFWIEHLISGYQFEGFEHGKYLKDDEKLHSFLKEKFLCWVESLSLMRSFYPQAQIALQKLKDLIAKYCGGGSDEGGISQAAQLQRESETHDLRQFTDDACRFVRNIRETLVRWPLQLYFSAMCFEKHNISIRKTFERTVRGKFGPSPILASSRHDQSSFRLQSSFRIPEESFEFFYGSGVSLLFAFSPDSLLISRMCLIKSLPAFTFWRADSGNSECAFQISADSRIAFFTDSNEFISVSQDGIMKRWNIDNKSCVWEQSLNLEYRSPLSSDVSFAKFDLFKGKVIALSPNGDLVASWHHNLYDGSVRVQVWDTYTACCGSSFSSGEKAYEYAAFSPNSQLLALLYKDGTRIHNTRTGAIVQYLNNRVGKEETSYPRIASIRDITDLERICFSPNSKFLVIVDSERQLSIWNTHTWELLREIEVCLQQFQRLMCLAISPDSAILVTGLSDRVEFWCIDTGECVAKATTCPRSMAFSPDWTKSSLMALQLIDGGIQIWSLSINQTITEVQHLNYAVHNVAISPDSRFVASTRRNEISVWSGDDGQLVHVLHGDISLLDSRLPCPIFSPDSQLLAYSNGYSCIQIWWVVTGTPVCLLKCQDRGTVSSLAFSSDSKHLIAGTYDGGIHSWRIDSGQLIFKYNITHQAWKLESPLLVAISPESAHIAAFWPIGGQSSHVQIWHLHTAQSVVVGPSQQAWKRPLGPYGTLTGRVEIYFSSDSAILASLTVSMAEIFDVTTGACLQRFTFDGNEHIRLLSFDAMKGRILTTNSVFYKTLSWNHWQTSPRLGYSYDYRLGGPITKSDTWILLDGKRNCFLPSNFRPALSSVLRKPAAVAMSDSILAVVNELGEVIIIKFPTWREVRQQAFVTFGAAPMFEGITDSAGNSYLAVDVPTASNSGSRNLIRKRDTSDESSNRDQSNSSSKRKK